MKFSKLLLDGFWICVRRNPPAVRQTVFHIRDGRLTINDSYGTLVPGGTEKVIDPIHLAMIDESINAALWDGDTVEIFKR